MKGGGGSTGTVVTAVEGGRKVCWTAYIGSGHDEALVDWVSWRLPARLLCLRWCAVINVISRPSLPPRAHSPSRARPARERVRPPCSKVLTHIFGWPLYDSHRLSPAVHLACAVQAASRGGGRSKPSVKQNNSPLVLCLAPPQGSGPRACLNSPSSVARGSDAERQLRILGHLYPGTRVACPTRLPFLQSTRPSDEPAGGHDCAMIA